jgi:hypothetical protein
MGMTMSGRNGQALLEKPDGYPMLVDYGAERGPEVIVPARVASIR